MDRHSDGDEGPIRCLGEARCVGMRIGMVSATGTARKRTIPALQGSKICMVTAIHGRNASKLAEVAGTYRIPHLYTDLSRFIFERKFDVAMVCSPPFLHYEHISELLAAGIPCLVEKPLSLTSKDAERLSQLAVGRCVPVRVAHQLRHQNTFEAIKNSLSNGNIGRPVCAALEWSFTLNRESPSSTWKLDPISNGKTSLYDAGSHCIDLAIGLFGPGIVCGVNACKLPGDGTYEHVDLLSQHGDVSCTIRASRLYGPFSNDLRISGTEGQITAPDFLTEKSSESIQIQTTSGIKTVAHTGADPYCAEVEDFVRVVEGGLPQYGDTDLKDAVAALRMLEEADRRL
jgi:predicted dehydrogenase